MEKTGFILFRCIVCLIFGCSNCYSEGGKEGEESGEEKIKKKYKKRDIEFMKKFREQHGYDIDFSSFPSEYKLTRIPKTYEKSFAFTDKAKHWSERNEIFPWNVFSKAGKKAWFNCSKCGHEFESNISNVTRLNRWCPYCVNKKLCGNTSCKTCFEKSFASFGKAGKWSQKNKIDPINVFKFGDGKAWFDCSECGHEFESYIKSVSRGRWCPYCSNQKLCGNASCKTCFEKSFASSERVNNWSQKNNISPINVFKYSNSKAWFNCSSCKHRFESITCNITNLNRWCPYCSNQKLCGNTSCKTCFEKSFASSERVNNWSQKNEIQPRNVFKYCHNKFWFNCSEYGHEFESALYNISGRGSWCPKCNETIGERIIREFFESRNIKIETQYKIEGHEYKYDGFIPLLKLLIEFDGGQHFRSDHYFVTLRAEKKNMTPSEMLEKMKKVDLIKTELAIKHGYHIVRISYLSKDKISSILTPFLENPRSLMVKTGNSEVDSVYQNHDSVCQEYKNP